MRTRIFQHQNGFALIENMVAVLLLSLGAVGIAVSTATTIKTNLDNQQRAIALNAASTALESLYIVAEADLGETLHTSLAAFVPSIEEGSESPGLVVYSNPDESGTNRDSFVVKVVKAVDAAGTDVLTSAAPYVSPVTVAVQVDYEGIAGKNVSGIEEIKTAKTSFTFVLKSS